MCEGSHTALGRGGGGFHLFPSCFSQGFEGCCYCYVLIPAAAIVCTAAFFGPLSFAAIESTNLHYLLFGSFWLWLLCFLSHIITTVLEKVGSS